MPYAPDPYPDIPIDIGERDMRDGEGRPQRPWDARDTYYLGVVPGTPNDTVTALLAWAGERVAPHELVDAPLPLPLGWYYEIGWCPESGFALWKSDSLCDGGPMPLIATVQRRRG